MPVSTLPAPELTLLYDGGCPLCLREVTFLHGRDRSFTVDDCLDLVTSAGLVFQDATLLPWLSAREALASRSGAPGAASQAVRPLSAGSDRAIFCIHTMKAAAGFACGGACLPSCGRAVTMSLRLS